MYNYMNVSIQREDQLNNKINNDSITFVIILLTSQLIGCRMYTGMEI
jgi:hypothetical protein